MAGTIIGNIALGVSDWSEWVTRQERGERGHLRVSLTDFADTTASTIAIGSILEIAGSIYQFASAETITLATGTASANTAVYFVAIPSAGGTTCTIEMDSTAPVWVDAKQGFYASAASVSRAIGGCYIGSAAVYYHKFLYMGDHLAYCLETGETRPLLKKIVEIGDWDMDATQTVNVAHGLGTFKKIRGLSAIVRNDVDTIYYKLEAVADGADPSLLAAGFASFTGGVISLTRRLGGNFDSIGFDSTSYNRGWITIEYEP